MSEPSPITFSLDGQSTTIEVDPKRHSLDVLRDELGLTSIKASCAPEGICGCCAILVDGKPRLACTLAVGRLEGKEVTTLDQLPEEEARIYAEAFTTTGGTQCGFCTPGIVIQTKALLDKNPDPTKAEIDKALRMHICRCTGWVKIRDAIQSAAQMRRDKVSPDPDAEGVGGDWRQESIRAAVLGRRPYIDDLSFDGMVHGAVVWTPHPRCRVDRIDTATAQNMPGVVAIATAKDLPGNRKVGLIYQDWSVLIAEGEETRCVADILAVVAAETPAQARAAAAAVVVEALRLEPVTDVVQAARDPERVLAMCKVKKGKLSDGLDDAAHVVDETFQTQVIDQAFLEPEASLAIPREDGGFHVYSCGQGVFDDQKQLCALYELPPEKMTIELVATGGAFGAKEDLNLQPHAVLLAKLTGRPAKIVFDMEESRRYHAKRHALRMHYTVGCDDQGQLVAVRARILGDTGGYASVGDKVLERAAGHACGPYRVPHVDIEALTIYTNNPVCGAMRGFGVNQTAFAMEGCLDRLADKLGIDKLEMRAKNLLHPGDVFATGQVMNEGCGVAGTLDALRPHYDAAVAAGKHVGVACGIKNVGMGNGLTEVGRVEFHVLSPGQIKLYTGFTEMGQGHDGVMSQMASEATGLSANTFVVECSTRCMVDTGMTTASRGTYLGGKGVQEAAKGLVKDLERVDGDLSKLVGQVYKGEWVAPHTDKPGSGASAPVTHYAFGYASQLAIVDADGKLEELVAAHDVGRAINRVGCEGQVEGAVHMGIGYALSEEQLVDEEGWPDPRYRSLGIIPAHLMPKITTLILEQPDPSGPWGAKGLGEIGLVPTAPAIAAAIQSHDGTWRNRLPLRDTPASKAVGERLPKPVKR